MKFKAGDSVVPKMPHPWNDICCVVTKIVNDKCEVSNGRGDVEIIEESKLDFLSDAVFEYTLRRVALDPEILKKTIFVIAPKKGGTAP